MIHLINLLLFLEIALSDDNSTSPGLCIFIHGGGFVLGDLDCYDDNCRRLCYLSGHKFALNILDDLG